MLRLEGVRMMEREAEAKRKRLEQTSPLDKPQDQPAGQVSLRLYCLLSLSKKKKITFESLLSVDTQDTDR